MTDSYLQSLVIHRCRELGDEKSAEFFAVSPGLIRQWLAGSKIPSLAAVEKVFVTPEVPPADAPWAGREVFLALPFYKTTSPRTLWSLLGIWDRAKFRAGMRYDDAYIIHAREQLAEDFMQTGLPICQWFDDDMVVPMGSAAWYNKHAEATIPERFAALNTPTQLRSRGKTVITGVYFGRKHKGRAVYAEALAETPEGNEENRRAHSAPFDDVRPTKWAGLGCLQHTREVLLDIQKTHSHLAPDRPGLPWHYFSNTSDALMRAVPELKEKIAAASAQVSGGTHDAALKTLEDVARQIDAAEKQVRNDSKLHQGEDQTFGQRAAVAGHQTWVDFSIMCGHVGTKVYNAQNTEA